VPNEPPVADPNGPYAALVGETVTFDGSASSDSDGTIVAYDWDFGDGNTGTGVSPTNAYAAPGTYTVTLTVTDDAGATDTASTTATIGEVPNEPPVADPNGPYAALVGETVTFDGSASSDSDGTIVAFRVERQVVLDEDGEANKAVRIRLDVRNRGSVDGAVMANVAGMQGGFPVYNETMMVSDPPGNGRSRFDFPSYVPTATGDIVWTATIFDGDPDEDTATAVTRVRQEEDDDDGDDDDGDDGDDGDDDDGDD
jgi:PKD repeat protein